ncbi:MAG: hypothetical protein O7B99_01965 [Planctomycetota bacterium]|nr:hypothetical protein [Planctomycetota bacterium]
MSPRSSIAFAAALLLVFGALPAAQDGDAPGVRCIKCKHVGRLPCPEHKRSDCKLEDNVLYCSFVAGCATCGGVGWIDCPRCDNEPVQEAIETKRAALPGFGEGLKEIDDAMGREVRKAESEHFVLVWEIDEMKVGKRRLSDHELLHLYVDRLEEVFDTYTEVLGAEEQEFEKKTKVMIWYHMQDHLRAGLYFCEGQGRSGIKLLGSTSVYSVSGTKRFFKDDEALHRNVVHSVAHLLLSHQRPSRWLGNISSGWADAGVAHWFEDRFFGICDNYCYQEVNSNRDFKGGKWRPAVRKMVAGDDAPPMAHVLQQNTTTLSLPAHAVSFSYIDFLIQKDPEKTNLMLKGLRSRVPARDAIQEIWGWKVLEFEREWKVWVLATYPVR